MSKTSKNPNKTAAKAKTPTFRAGWLQWGLTLAFGLLVFLFWYLPYRCALNFQEQYQLFLFSGSYLAERLAVPGGLADYLGEFVVQFYFMPPLGAALLALLFVALQRLTWRLALQQGATAVWYPLTFLPPVVLLGCMGDENVLLSLAVALIFAQLAMLLWNRISGSKVAAAVYLVIGLPLFYWLMGACAWLVVVHIVLHGFVQLRARKACLAGLVAALMVLLGIVVSYQLVHYSLARLATGLNYYRYPLVLPLVVLLPMLVFSCFDVLVAALSRLQLRSRIVLVAVQLVLLLGTGYGMWRHYYAPSRYELINCDYLVRARQWDQIIRLAERKSPSTPLSVSCLNLALAQNGQLGDRLFEFYQNGPEGLFPAFNRDFFSPVSTGEVFWALGFVNDAERYAFEAQEAVPNHRKSGRLCRRIAEANIIDGNYAVAARYLRMLQQAPFYHRWATDAMALLGREQAIDAHPVFGRLRSLQPKSDYLFSQADIDHMLTVLFTGNTHNTMAYEYLVSDALLSKDLGKFNAYYPLGQHTSLNHIPVACHGMA